MGRTTLVYKKGHFKMIGFQDFVPQVKESGAIFKRAVMEELNEPLKRANEWIIAHELDVINIETVVLPNIHSPHEEGSTDTELVTIGKFSTNWYQIIRVWYRA